MRYRPLFTATAMAIGAVNAPVLLSAQQPGEAPRPTVATVPAVRVVAVRSELWLRRALEQARMDERDAEATVSRATDERAQAKARIEVKKRELATIDARRKLADAEKNEAAKAELKAEKRAGEAERKLAERLDAVFESEIELAKKNRDLAKADQRALELELQLAERRAERDRAQADPAAVQRLERELVRFERQVLEARRDRAAIAKDVATREEKIAERRIDLFKANLAASGVE
jgi:chromosome segregation ATPase